MAIIDTGKGLKGLKGIDKQEEEQSSSGLLAAYLSLGDASTETLSKVYTPTSSTKVGVRAANMGYGDWKDDDEINDISLLDNLQEVRAQNQSGLYLLAAGATKFLTTAATTLIDNTVGFFVGMPTLAMKNWYYDGTPNFMEATWNNDITNAMADITDYVEEAMPNYQSEWEQNANVFLRMVSPKGMANFWGNDILHNAGFTVGSALSLLIGGEATTALKGVKALGKVGNTLGKGMGLLDATGTATKFGKTAAWTAKTYMTSVGESSLEALMAYRDNKKDMQFSLNNRVDDLIQQAEDLYDLDIADGMSLLNAEAYYQKRRKQIEEDSKAYQDQMEKELSDASNAIFAVNMALLGVSNNLTLGSMIRGGYGNASSLLARSIRTVDGKLATGVKDLAKGLLNGTLKFEPLEIKHGGAKVAGKALTTMFQEGFVEEGGQNLASNTGILYTLAKMNKWAKKNSTLGSMINEDASEELTNIAKAVGKAYEENFGHLNSPGWTEVAAGFITGGLGTPFIRRNSEGKFKPTWLGGIREAYESVYGEKKATEEAIAKLDKALTDGKFGERAKHAVEQLAIKAKQDKTLLNKDIQGYKNAEIEQLVSDALYAKNFDLLDAYLEMFNEMGAGLSDKDVEQLKTLTIDTATGTNTLAGLTNDEIKQRYQEKAQVAKEKIEKILEEYDAADKQYGDLFSDETRKFAILEITFKNALLWDLYRRADELETEINELEEKGDKRTNSETLSLKEKKKGRDKVLEQANELRDELNEIKNDPETLDKNILKALDIARKRRDYKEASKAIAKYKEAQTLQDIVDIYSLSPEDTREKTLTDAIAQTTDAETKLKLSQFKNYIGDVNAMESLIEQRFPVENANVEGIQNIQKLLVFKNILNEIVNEMLKEASPVLTRDNLKAKLEERLKEFTTARDEANTKATGIKRTELGTYDFNDAFSLGLITEDDFDSIINEEGEEEIVPKQKLLNAIKSLLDKENYDDLINDINYFIDNLDKIDELRKTAVKPTPKENKKKSTVRKKSKVTFTEESLEDDTEEKDKKKKKTVTEEVPEDVVIDEEDDSEEMSWDEEEDDNEEEEEDETPSKEILSAEEAKLYDVIDKKGKNGVTYHTVKPKDPKYNGSGDSTFLKAKKIANLISKLEQIDALQAKDPSTKNAIIKKELEKLKDLIDNNPIGNKSMQKAEALFELYKHLLSPAKKKEKLHEKDEHKGGGTKADADTVSLNGNQFPGYVKSELNSDGAKMVSYDSPVQTWMRDQGFHVQRTIDIFLPKIIERDSKKKPEDRTPVHYLSHGEQENVIFLGMKYSEVQDVMPRDLVDVVKTLDGDYVIIGTLGWDSHREGTREMFNTIKSNIKDEIIEYENPEYKGWFVSSATNRIKDLGSGYIVKQLEGENSNVFSLGELLAAHNPLNLTLDNIKWAVIEGKEDAPTIKYINIDEEKDSIYSIKEGKPGQVYMFIPDTTGSYVPIYMETVFLNDGDTGFFTYKTAILRGEDGYTRTPFINAVSELLQILADPEKSMKDKKSAVAKLKDYLVFSPVNNIHVNDESFSLAPNSIQITVKGEVEKVIDFEETHTLEENLQALVWALSKINPRINIRVTTLGSNPEFYTLSNLLQTNIATLNTVNSAFYLYPVDDEGNFKINKILKAVYKPTANTRQRLYLGGQLYYYDGVSFFDGAGDIINDNTGQLTIAKNIKEGKYKEIKYKRGKYYDVDGVMYMDNGHGGLDILTPELREKVLKGDERDKKKKAKDDKVKEIVEDEKDKLDAKKERDAAITRQLIVHLKDSGFTVLDKAAMEKYLSGHDIKNLLLAIEEQTEMDTIKQKAIADGTFMKAPNGKPTNLNERQWLQVRTTNFKNWFGDWENDPANASKVVDENGEPLVVYHGSEEHFRKFDANAKRKHDLGVYGKGFYFTSNKKLAKEYGNNKELYEVFLNIRTPYNAQEDFLGLFNNFNSEKELRDYFRSEGFSEEELDNVDFGNYDNADGVITFGEQDEIVVKNPNQIKSATDNNGDFLLTNDDILLFTTPQGEIYGFVDKEGNIYLDETKISPEHPIHEYTHLWDRFIQKKNPKLWQRGVELMKQTSLWNEILNDPNYGKVWLGRGLSQEELDNYVASEVHARLAGEEGAKVLEELAEKEGSDNIIGKLKKWLKDYWKGLKSSLGGWTKKDLANLSVEDFSRMPIRDFVKATTISTMSEKGSLKPTDDWYKNERNFTDAKDKKIANNFDALKPLYYEYKSGKITKEEFLQRAGSVKDRIEQFFDAYDKAMSASEEAPKGSDKEDTKRKKPSTPVNKGNNFTNGTEISDLKTTELLQESQNNSTFAGILKKRDNKEKKKELFNLLSSKTGLSIDSIELGVQALVKLKIDISSSDIDKVIDLVKNCR